MKSLNTNPRSLGRIFRPETKAEYKDRLEKMLKGAEVAEARLKKVNERSVARQESRGEKFASVIESERFAPPSSSDLVEAQARILRIRAALMLAEL
jgi:hypothetical protein